MAWKLSLFRAGDLIEVRSKEEILATLDERGCVDGMPFMPEMLPFCGKRFRVSAVAHKTCETAHKTWQGRRLQATVHLTGLSCDGSAHGGCDAKCNLFWKDVWLKPLGAVGTKAKSPTSDGSQTPNGESIESRLLANTQMPGSREGEPHYSCQTTQLYEATQPLRWWDPRQYVFDVVTRNHSVGRVLRVLTLATLRWCVAHTPFAWRMVRGMSDRMHRGLTGRPAPFLNPKVKPGIPTPTGKLDLKPGDLVRIKSQQEIEETLDEAGKNRGLQFDQEEMSPYCGRVVKVRSIATKILDEVTGKMLRMKQPCILLEGVVCNGEYAGCRLNCPRAIPSYWREVWLERVECPTTDEGGTCSTPLSGSEAPLLELTLKS